MSRKLHLARWLGTGFILYSSEFAVVKASLVETGNQLFFGLMILSGEAINTKTQRDLEAPLNNRVGGFIAACTGFVHPNSRNSAIRCRIPLLGDSGWAIPRGLPFPRARFLVSIG